MPHSNGYYSQEAYNKFNYENLDISYDYFPVILSLDEKVAI